MAKKETQLEELNRRRQARVEMARKGIAPPPIDSEKMARMMQGGN